MQDIRKHVTHKHSTETLLVIVFTLLALLLLAPRVHSQDLTSPSASPSEALSQLSDTPNGPLPAGTRLLSLHVTHGLAVANFSRDLKANFTGGDSQEVAAVNSVLRVLGRYPEIKRTQILVAGQPVDSLGGLIVLSSPLPVLRPDQDNGGHTRRMFLHRKTTPEKATPQKDAPEKSKAASRAQHSPR